MRCELIISQKIKIKSRQWLKKKLKELGKSALKYTDKKNHKLIKHLSFTVLITNNKEIQNLNKKFRSKNKPTDVLSFPSNTINKEKIYLGDIAISHEKAIEQSHKKRLSAKDEILMLAIHGYLHLLGYDHKKKKDSKKMFDAQNKILIELLFNNNK